MKRFCSSSKVGFGNFLPLKFFVIMKVSRLLQNLTNLVTPHILSVNSLTSFGSFVSNKMPKPKRRGSKYRKNCNGYLIYLGYQLLIPCHLGKISKVKNVWWSRIHWSYIKKSMNNLRNKTATKDWQSVTTMIFT